MSLCNRSPCAWMHIAMDCWLIDEGNSFRLQRQPGETRALLFGVITFGSLFSILLHSQRPLRQHPLDIILYPQISWHRGLPLILGYVFLQWFAGCALGFSRWDRSGTPGKLDTMRSLTFRSSLLHDRLRSFPGQVAVSSRPKYRCVFCDSTSSSISD